MATGLFPLSGALKSRGHESKTRQLLGNLNQIRHTIKLQNLALITVWGYVSTS